MKYFKNTELAKLYNVSEKSVRNWIQASQEGKLELELFEKEGRVHILNSANNIAQIKQLVVKGKKYKNGRSYKVVEPTEKFYELYNDKQIFDILSNIDTYREIPRQYNYFDEGADYWDKYLTRLSKEETPNILNSALKLFDANQSYIDELLEEYDHVNIIDIGVGNAIPVKDLLSRLKSENKLGRYIAIDISSQMLEIARSNIKKWFDDSINFEGHLMDINYDRFSDLLVQEYLKKGAEKTVNLVLVLGGTLANFRNPNGAFRAIHESMSRKDLLLISQKLDSEATRHYFDFNADTKTQPLAPQYKFIIDLLNIDPSYYSVEVEFDEKVKARLLRIRFNVAISIKFKFNNGERTIDLHKDECLLMWRYWHQTALDVSSQLRENEFYPLLMSHTEDKNYIMTISQIQSTPVA